MDSFFFLASFLFVHKKASSCEVRALAKCSLEDNTEKCASSREWKWNVSNLKPCVLRLLSTNQFLSHLIYSRLNIV